jgi:hypothetical protein
MPSAPAGQIKKRLRLGAGTSRIRNHWWESASRQPRSLRIRQMWGSGRENQRLWMPMAGRGPYPIGWSNGEPAQRVEEWADQTEAPTSLYRERDPGLSRRLLHRRAPGRRRRRQRSATRPLPAPDLTMQRPEESASVGGKRTSSTRRRPHPSQSPADPAVSLFQKQTTRWVSIPAPWRACVPRPCKMGLMIVMPGLLTSGWL